MYEKFSIIELYKILLLKLGHEYAKRIYKTAMPYIMIDVIYDSFGGSLQLGVVLVVLLSSVIHSFL